MSKLTLLPNPEKCPGGYVLHLYCRYANDDHGFREFPWEMVDDETYAQAAKTSRAAGWLLHRDRTATCPKCAKALAKSSPA